jgi:hypothetical protein
VVGIGDDGFVAWNGWCECVGIGKRAKMPETMITT